VAKGRRDDLTGLRFGNLTVTSHRRKQRGTHTDVMWLCECTCGARTWKRADNLKAGRVKSCSLEHQWSGS
jgi:hypothetical protein